MQQPLSRQENRADDLQRTDLSRQSQDGAEVVSHPFFPHPLWILYGEWQDEEKRILEEVFLQQFSKFARQGASPSRNPMVVERRANGACTIRLGNASFGALFSGDTPQEAAARLSGFWNFQPKK